MTGQTNEAQWYIARDGKQHGPLTDVEMNTFVSHSYLRPSDLLWRPGMDDWQPAPSVFPHAFQPQQPAQPAPQSQGAQPQTARSGQPQGQPQGGGGYPQQSAQPQGGPAQSPAAQHGGQYSAQPMAAQRPAANQSSQGGAPFAAQPSGPSPAQAGQSAGAPHYDEQAQQSGYGTEHFDEERPRGGLGRQAAIAAALVALIGGGAFAIATYREPLMQLVAGSPKKPPAVAAEKTDAEPVAAAPAADAGAARQADTQAEAATPPPTDATTVAEVAADPAASAAASTMDPSLIEGSAIDKRLQKIPFWTMLKRDYPDWYIGSVATAEKSAAESKPPAEVTSQLVQGLVNLRRQHAEKALAASPEKLKNVAAAFLENLRALQAQSVGACYGFISKGEMSPVVVELMEKPESAGALSAHIMAVFDAVAEGSKAPVKHSSAVKADYDVLIAELGKLGWKEEDLQIFSNPRLLAKREPAQVCKMVQDWFVAHLAVQDAAAQERLLYETLKPVVSG